LKNRASETKKESRMAPEPTHADAVLDKREPDADRTKNPNKGKSGTRETSWFINRDLAL
jgi:hypothetical protein